MLNAKLIRLFLFLALILPLSAQSYQTSFSEVNVDRVKGGSTSNAIYQVDPASGALEVNIPIGSGIGEGGIHFTPTLIAHNAQQISYVNVDSVYGPSNLWTLLPNYMSFLPGYLDLKTGPACDYNNNNFVSRYELWNGINGSFDGAVTPVESQIDGLSLLHSFDYQTETVAVMKPFGLDQPGAVPFMKYTSNGDIFIALYEAGSAPLFSIGMICWNTGFTYTTPSKVLLIRNGIAYEFSSIFKSPKGYGYTFNRFRLTSIRNQFKERIDIAYSGAANVIDYTATWVRNGASTGIKVEAKYGGNSIISVNYLPLPSESGTGESFGITASLANADTSIYEGLSGLRRVLGSPQNTDMTQIETSMYLRVDNIKNNNNNTNTQFTYTGATYIGTLSYQLPTGIKFPSGKQVTFTWEFYPYRRNDAKNGVWDGYYTQLFKAEYKKSVQELGVKTVTEVDLGGQTRTTSYARTVPVPLSNTSRNAWSSLDFYTAITQPDGSVLVETYWPPLQNSDGGPSSPLTDQLQTLAHLKHVVKERRFYASGVDWKSDRSVSVPSSSTAHKVIQYSGLDIKRDGIPGTSFKDSCVPIPTSVQIFDNTTGITEINALNNFLTKNGEYAWQDTNRTISGNSASYLSTMSRAFSPLPQFGIFPRVTKGVTTVNMDTTGGLASSFTLPVSLPYTQTSFDSTNPILNKIDNQKLTGNPETITTSFAYQAASGFGGNKVDNIAVQSGSFTGTIGIDNFGYDTFGRMSSIRQSGVIWSVGQEQDFLGRPSSQTDANGLKTQFLWDGASRLTDIKPPTPGVVTHIDYAADQRGATVTRGALKSEYRYNGFGEIVLIRRWDSGFIASHKAFAYDPMGRKTFESVWLSGHGTENEGLSYGTILGDRWAYDGVGRLTDHIDPNGVVTHTAYDGLNKTVTVAYGTTDAASTTFTFDGLGRLLKVTDALSQVTKYQYDPAGRLAKVSQTDPVTNGTQNRNWTYNSLGWLISLTQPESGTTSYSDFTVGGHPQTTNYAGLVVKTTFDGLMRPLTVLSSDLPVSVNQSFFYDEPGRGFSNGKLTTSLDKNVRLLRSYGDPLGRLSALDTYLMDTRSSLEEIYSQRFSYDDYGQRTSASIQDASGLRTIQTGWDNARGMANLVTFTGGGLNAANLALIPTFDPQSWMPVSISYPKNNATTVFSYRADQKGLATMGHHVASVPVLSWVYDYDKASRLKGDGIDGFTYDPLGRLGTASIKRMDGSILNQKFTYDAFGNQTESLVTSGIPSELSKVLTNFTFNGSDPAFVMHNQIPGRLANGAYTGAHYDTQGNLDSIYKQPNSSLAGITMTYDALGRVITMVDNERGIKEKYFYTPEGLRTRTEVYLNGVLDKVKVKLYNDQRQFVSEYETQ